MSTETAIAALAAKSPDTTVERPATILQLIESQRGEIEKALPAHMGADRLARVAITTIKSDSKLSECTAQSLVGALMVAAGLGLELGPAMGHAYLVPFNNNKTGHREAQLIVGYKGLLDLARRSGQIRALFAEVVRENDQFELVKGTGGHLIHKFDPWSPRGPVVGYYAFCEFAAGGFHSEEMSLEEMHTHMDRFAQKSNGKVVGPWSTDFDAMARKTMIRRAAPYLPLTVEATRAVAADETTHTLDRVLDEISPRAEDAEGVTA